MNNSIKKFVLSISFLLIAIAQITHGMEKDDIIRANKIKNEQKLLNACIRHTDNEVENLLLIGTNPNTQDHYGNTPLHCAIKCYNLNNRIAKSLAQLPSGMNARKDMDEVKLTVQTLLDYGASTNIKNNENKTPLDLCDENMRAMILDLPLLPISNRLNSFVSRTNLHQSPDSLATLQRH